MPDTAPPTCPMSREQVINRYFLEHRAKLIDLAAFLDRVDRAAGSPAGDDHRIAALHRALDLLREGQPERARRVLEVFSDRTTDPVPAAGDKHATGAAP